MVIVALKGGLGNQLFQYAFSEHLKKKYNQTIFFDIHYLNLTEKNLTKRGLLLDQLFAPLKIIDDKTLTKFITHNSNLLSRVYKKAYRSLFNFRYFSENDLNLASDNLVMGSINYVDGYWQYEHTAEGIIEEMNSLTFEILKDDPQAIKINSSPSSVAIHIRRGDYVENSFINSYHGHCDLNYFLQAITVIQQCVENPQFFIFSDDLNWARQNLNLPNASFIEGNLENPIHDLYLMKSCLHQVISNSSFSCWASYLNVNPDKIVIAPKNWTTRQKTKDLPLYDKKWILL